MNILICSTNDFDIYQDKNKSTLFTIISKKYNNTNNNDEIRLFNSIVNTGIINTSTILKDKTQKSMLTIKALSIQNFKNFKENQNKMNGNDKLSLKIISSLIYSLSNQIHYLLSNESKCFYKIDIDNILVIDNNKFIYLSYEHLKDVKNKCIYIYCPISKNIGYLSPELLNTSSIPIIINYKTIFYSIGLLILDNIKEKMQIEPKLYYFLERCLMHEPNKRYLLYV